MLRAQAGEAECVPAAGTAGAPNPCAATTCLVGNDCVVNEVSSASSPAWNGITVMMASFTGMRIARLAHCRMGRLSVCPRLGSPTPAPSQAAWLATTAL